MDVPAIGDASLIPALITRVMSHPEHCAMRFRGTSITNGDLLRAASQFAGWLHHAGLGHGARVGVCLDRGPGTLAMLLALWMSGMVYVPLDPALPRERLFSMCTTASLDVIVTEARLTSVTARLPCALMMLEEAALTAPASGSSAFGASLERLPLAADDLAYILFTSGSSGVPKGVRIGHGNLAALVAGILPLLELREGCRLLGCARFGFDIAFFELLAPLLCGGTLVLADSDECRSPLALLQLIEREQVTVVQATPSHWQLLTALPWTHSLDVAIATGEALMRGTASAVLRHSERLWNLYGPTECTIWASAHRVVAEDLLGTAPAVVSIGSAIPGYSLTITAPDASGGGELVIHGDGVGLGYCGEQGTNGAFRPCPLTSARTYHSGDLCRRDAAGLLHYLGRLDMQVKHNGYRIDLGEIEHLLQRHMSIQRAACGVYPPGEAVPGLLFACIEARAGSPNRNKKTLNDYLADHLPAWMLPQRYFFVDHLPVTDNGKLDRTALRAMAAPVSTRHQPGSLEARVAAIFCDVLGIDRIGPCDSFLDLGGSSMLAATLVLALNEHLGSGLTLRQALATPPTVDSIVQLLRAAPASSVAS
ncbi:MAG TPA: non-ribosomal peptide synthetase [Pseudomonadales bacterium]